MDRCLCGSTGKCSSALNHWLLTCQVVINPINEMTTNREGIIRVVRTMKWYSSLTKLLLRNTSEHDQRFAELRRLLADRILDLYKALLKYIIKSVCAYDRHAALTFLRKSVRLDDWTGSLDDVSKAEILSERPPVTTVSGKPIHTLDFLSTCMFPRNKTRFCRSCVSPT